MCENDVKIIRNRGWHVLRNWNIQDFEPNFILKQLHIKYGVTPYFKVSIQPNPRSPGTNSITISPSGLGLPDRSYYYLEEINPIQEAYKQLIRDVVIYLSVTQTDAERFSSNMFSYEKRIAEITPSSYEMLNPLNTYNPIKISELKLTVASLPLQDILTAMFPESHITEETEVIVTSLNYLVQVSQITASSDRALLNNYVIWTLVRQYLPYLSLEFTSTLAQFESKLFGLQHSVQRWEKCAYLVQDFMELAIESIFETQNPINNKTKTVIHNIFTETVEVAKERLIKQKLPPQLYKHLSNKLAKIQIQIGLPNITEREFYIKQYYSKLMILKANLFDSCKNGLTFKRKIEEQYLISPHLHHKLISYSTKPLYQITYSPDLNTVVVPRTVLSESVFEDKFPSSILYSRIGVEIADAVISSILPHGSAWTSDLKLLSPFHLIINESHEAINNTNRCLLNYINNHKLTVDNADELTALSTLKHLSAVDIAHETLKMHIEDQPHIHYPSLENLEDSALFFLTYAQSQCSISAKQQELYQNIVNHELSQKSLLETSWWHLKQFSNSVGCSDKHELCSDIF